METSLCVNEKKGRPASTLLLVQKFWSQVKMLKLPTLHTFSQTLKPSLAPHISTSLFISVDSSPSLKKKVSKTQNNKTP